MAGAGAGAASVAGGADAAPNAAAAALASTTRGVAPMQVDIDEGNWKFVQSFGDDNSSDDDLVTAVEFDETGTYLAVGDKAGRICIFEGHPDQKAQRGGRRRVPLEYKFYTEFQSHEPEFDCLKSLEIEEKINMIKWHKRQAHGALFLLATNDKTIKFWKVHDKKIKQFKTSATGAQTITSAVSNGAGPGGLGAALTVPRAEFVSSQTQASPKRVYANAHGYHINSISINSDGETFISADDLRVNLWNLEVSNESFNIVDVKPANLEELTEVITSAAFHPQSCNILLYSSSRGSIRLGDLRGSALCDHHSKLFEIEEDPASKSFFSEIISSISDAKFTPDGRYIISRDYLTVKVWDVNMESKPVLSVPVHDYLKMHLCDLYENDCIFDKFEVAASNDGLRFLTGSYNNNFVIHSQDEKRSLTIEALKDPPRRPAPGSRPAAAAAAAAAAPAGSTSPNSKKKQLGAAAAAAPTAAAGAGLGKPGDKGPSAAGKGDGKKKDKPPAPAAAAAAAATTAAPGDEPSPNVNQMDFGKKALHVAWHPRQDVVAVAGLNKLYIYQMT